MQKSFGNCKLIVIFALSILTIFNDDTRIYQNQSCRSGHQH